MTAHLKTETLKLSVPFANIILLGCKDLLKIKAHCFEEKTVTLTILCKHKLTLYASEILFPKIKWKIKSLAYLTAVEIISPSGWKNGLARTLAKISKTVRPVGSLVLKCLVNCLMYRKLKFSFSLMSFFIRNAPGMQVTFFVFSF